ncbi:GNAT family N-acetyltransferase [Bacillus pinisoli]|uniref:GNAT family N-acetyltransferase n=1 Tax=Bacillus pinisoli TaxID=2901866 RepID=UPI001FF1B231|nr:GNAT family N-acetyltransferase [Bacillus pinisoli]
MKILLEPVSKNNEVILQNLYSLYLHDLSAFTNELNISQKGDFVFDSHHLFWTGQGVEPYFIKDGDTLIGFITLLKRPFLKKEFDFAINDIFILNKYRGKGYGIPALKEVFSNHSGSYFVIELAVNKAAVQFWKKVYGQLSIEYNEISQEVDSENCLIQTFNI